MRSPSCGHCPAGPQPTLPLVALQQQRSKQDSLSDSFITRIALVKERRPPPGNIWAPLLIVWQLMSALKTEGTSDIK